MIKPSRTPSNGKGVAEVASVVIVRLVLEEYVTIRARIGSVNASAFIFTYLVKPPTAGFLAHVVGLRGNHNFRVRRYSSMGR
jgi:hypothetical protein